MLRLGLGLFNFCAEYIMQNAGLDEAQVGIKIVGRNINNLRCADDTTFMADNPIKCYKDKIDLCVPPEARFQD